jgi:putative sigma-54 modulation protein
MNLTVRGVHYNPSDETRAFLDKKLAILSFAEDYCMIWKLSLPDRRWAIGYHIDAKLHFFLGNGQSWSAMTASSCSKGLS